MEEILNYAMVYCEYAGRTTINEFDIRMACKKVGVSLFFWIKNCIIII